jgi:predicted metal-binding transcription factor (methanogenesis marker protein 9)
MTTMTIKMPDQMSMRLRQQAAELGMNGSEFIRQAVEKLLDAGPPATAGTCLSLASDLVGCLEGSRDLATNPDHMKGFGG